MHRRLTSIVALAALAVVAPSIAGADEVAAVDSSDAPAAAESDPVADQEIGGRIGVRMGGRTTPGGFTVGGVFLYRITGALWSDSAVSFAIGGGGAECFRNRQDEVICDHSQLDGIAGGLHSGLRWVRPGKQGFVPYARATVGVELVNYADDDVRGFAVPFTVGGGVRARVADRISVGGGADLQIGFARLNRDIGIEPQLAMVVRLGVDFAL